MGYKIDFLPVDKHKHFLQIDSINFMHSRAPPEHSKQKFNKIFAIFQGKRKSSI